MRVKTKIVLSAALVLTLCGTVFANDSDEDHQDDRDAVLGGRHATFTANVGHSHALNHHVKSSLTPEFEGALFETKPPNHGRKPALLYFHLTPNPFERSDDFVW
jgi:hypothetical protein